MKKSLFIIFTCVTIMNVNAQDSSMLYGQWQIISTDGTENNFIKVTKDERNWGHFIEFYEDGTYVENASAPCGLDDNRFSYHGKWSYDSKNKIIQLKEIVADIARPNIYNNYKVLSSGAIQLLSAKPDELKTKVTKAWEKISSKR